MFSPRAGAGIFTGVANSEFTPTLGPEETGAGITTRRANSEFSAPLGPAALAAGVHPGVANSELNGSLWPGKLGAGTDAGTSTEVVASLGPEMGATATGAGTRCENSDWTASDGAGAGSGVSLPEEADGMV